MYLKQVGTNSTYGALYVGDQSIASNNTSMSKKETKLLQIRFNAMGLGEANYCLGIQIQRNREQKQIHLHCRKMGRVTVNQFPLPKSKPKL